MEQLNLNYHPNYTEKRDQVISLLDTWLESLCFRVSANTDEVRVVGLRLKEEPIHDTVMFIHEYQVHLTFVTVFENNEMIDICTDFYLNDPVKYINLEHIPTGQITKYELRLTDDGKYLFFP